MVNTDYCLGSRERQATEIEDTVEVEKAAQPVRLSISSILAS